MRSSEKKQSGLERALDTHEATLRHGRIPPSFRPDASVHAAGELVQLQVELGAKVAMATGLLVATRPGGGANPVRVMNPDRLDFFVGPAELPDLRLALSALDLRIHEHLKAVDRVRVEAELREARARVAELEAVLDATKRAHGGTPDRSRS